MNAPLLTSQRRRIYLMRHGSVNYFAPDGTPLPPHNVPLNDNGVLQATAAGKLFVEQQVAFDRVIVSGLPRTVQTATLVLDQLGQSHPIEHQPTLAEIQSGKLADIPVDQLRASFTHIMDGTAALDTRFLGGETLGEMLDRVLPTIDLIRQDTAWQTLLLVLHGGVNRGVLSYLLSGEKRLLGGFEQSPACINVIDVGVDKRDVILRTTNLSPTDWLQRDTRSTTMEMLLGQYAKNHPGNATSSASVGKS